MTAPIKAPKKLFEVALPLADINEASVRENSSSLQFKEAEFE